MFLFTQILCVKCNVLYIGAPTSRFGGGPNHLAPALNIRHVIANTVPLYNICKFCNSKKTGQLYISNFSESSKSRMQRFEEPQFGHPWYSE